MYLIFRQVMKQNLKIKILLEIVNKKKLKTNKNCHIHNTDNEKLKTIPLSYLREIEPMNKSLQ